MQPSNQYRAITKQLHTPMPPEVDPDAPQPAVDPDPLPNDDPAIDPSPAPEGDPPVKPPPVSMSQTRTPQMA